MEVEKARRKKVCEGRQMYKDKLETSNLKVMEHESTQCGNFVKAHVFAVRFYPPTGIRGVAWATRIDNEGERVWPGPHGISMVWPWPHETRPFVKRCGQGHTHGDFQSKGDGT